MASPATLPTHYLALPEGASEVEVGQRLAPMRRNVQTVVPTTTPRQAHAWSSRNPRPVALLLGDRLAGAARLFGEVLELGEAIFHAQHGRLVVDVHLGCKRKSRDRRRVDVDQAPLRMPRQQMAAADLAPLPVAPLVLVVLADLVFSLGHLDRLGLPER